MGFDQARFALLLLWGGLVALDGASFGQFMVSRPMVAATIAGWLVGSPIQGAVVGVILETFHLAILPVGAAKYPEGGPPAVAAGAAYAISDHEPSTLLIVVLGALILERLGGETVRYLRLANVGISSAGTSRPELVANLERKHLTALAVDFARGLLLTLAGLMLLGYGADWLPQFWGLPERVARILLVATVAGMLASIFRMVGSLVWYAAAGAGAAVIVVVLLNA